MTRFLFSVTALVFLFLAAYMVAQLFIEAWLEAVPL